MNAPVLGSLDSVIWKPPTPSPTTLMPTAMPSENVPLGALLGGSDADLLSNDGSKDNIFTSTDNSR